MSLSDLLIHKNINLPNNDDTLTNRYKVYTFYDPNFPCFFKLVIPKKSLLDFQKKIKLLF